MRILFFNIVSIILALGALYLAINEKAGWGWFLFGAIIIFDHIKLPKK